MRRTLALRIVLRGRVCLEERKLWQSRALATEGWRRSGNSDLQGRAEERDEHSHVGRADAGIAQKILVGPVMRRKFFSVARNAAANQRSTMATIAPVADTASALPIVTFSIEAAMQRRWILKRDRERPFMPSRKILPQRKIPASASRPISAATPPPFSVHLLGGTSSFCSSRRRWHTFPRLCMRQPCTGFCAPNNLFGNRK